MPDFSENLRHPPRRKLYSAPTGLGVVPSPSPRASPWAVPSRPFGLLAHFFKNPCAFPVAQHCSHLKRLGQASAVGRLGEPAVRQATARASEPMCGLAYRKTSGAQFPTAQRSLPERRVFTWLECYRRATLKTLWPIPARARGSGCGSGAMSAGKGVHVMHCGRGATAGHTERGVHVWQPTAGG